MDPIEPEEFEALVGDALDGVPDELWDRFENLAVFVEDSHPDEPDLLGLFEGIPLTDRWDYAGVLPDRITIYRLPLCDLAADREELVHEVRVTVIHELAHHVGFSDETLHELGWA